MSFRSITLTVCNRPDYLRRLLDSLRRNDCEGWRLYVGLEPVSDECAKICREISFLPTTVIENRDRLGVRVNPFNVLDYVFYKGATLNVYLEDDLVLAPDALAFASWYGAELRGDLLGDQRTLCLRLHVPSRGHEDPDAVTLARSFAPLGFVLSREQWLRYFRPAWFNDGHELAPSVGWDFSVQALLSRDAGLTVAAPALARANHIGATGTHMNPALNAATYGDVVLATAAPPGGRYRIVS
jgi:hypothetical protein